MVWQRVVDYITLPRTSPVSTIDLGISKGKPLMLQFFEWNSQGNDTKTWWQIFEQEIPNLAQMGFSHVWLPPPNKAMTKEGRGYDAYDLWDLGEFDQKEGRATRWGTKEQLISACSTAKAHGIGVIVDAVLNHKLGADQTEMFSAVRVDPQNRNIEISPVEEIEGWTRFEFPGREGQHSEFKWTQKHFTGVDYDNRTRSDGIFKITGEGHEGWSKYVDKEFGNYDFFLGADINHKHPEVKKDLLSWGSWILKTTSCNGLRFDAIKHIDYKFLLEFIRHSRGCTKNLFVVSECWSGNYKTIRKYMRVLRGETSFFDVPLHEKFHLASRLGHQFDFRKILSETLVKHRPRDAVTFVDNHDTVFQIPTSDSLLPFGLIFDLPGDWSIFRKLEVESWFKPHAYALILLRRQGFPCVFYGDLYPGDLYDSDLGPVLTRLISLRQNFTHGEQIDLIKHSPLANCIGFVHTGVDSSRPGCVVLLSNANEQKARNKVISGCYHTVSMCAGKRNGRKRYQNVFGNVMTSPEVSTNASGEGKFHCPFGKIAVWIETTQIVFLP